jgi:7-keto-8-aminopelargonate synthetase-like enzyme
VDLLEESTELVDKLWANAKYFKEEMKKLGFDTGMSAKHPSRRSCSVKRRWRSNSAANSSKKVYFAMSIGSHRAEGQGAHPRHDLRRA